MANPYRGEVKITLDRERTLLINGNAMVEAEEILGQQFDLTKIFELGARGLRALLYVGLKKEDPTLTIEGAGELFVLSDQGRIMEAILNSAWGGFVPDEVKARAEQTAKNAQRTVSRGDSETVSAQPSELALTSVSSSS